MSLPELISKCELVKLRHINHSDPVFWDKNPVTTNNRNKRVVDYTSLNYNHAMEHLLKSFITHILCQKYLAHKPQQCGFPRVTGVTQIN